MFAVCRNKCLWVTFPAAPIGLTSACKTYQNDLVLEIAVGIINHCKIMSSFVAVGVLCIHVRGTMYVQGGPKKRTFLRYHIFAATTDTIMQFLLKCSEITAENNKRQFFLNER